jgi:peptidoglycan hydrolase CwlO-like protein
MFGRRFSRIESTLDLILEKQEKTLERIKKLQMTVQDAIQVLADENVKLDDIGTKLTEGFTEITALIGQLQNTDLTPDQEAIVTSLQSKVDSIQPQAQQIADIVPGP